MLGPGVALKHAKAEDVRAQRAGPWLWLSPLQGWAWLAKPRTFDVMDAGYLRNGEPDGPSSFSLVVDRPQTKIHMVLLPFHST